MLASLERIDRRLRSELLWDWLGEHSDGHASQSLHVWPGKPGARPGCRVAVRQAPDRFRLTGRFRHAMSDSP